MEWWLASGVDVAALGADWSHTPPKHWGQGWPVPSEIGNFAGLETTADPQRPAWEILNRRDLFPRVAPAGSFLRGLHGFYDLDGNLTEWIADTAFPTEHPLPARVVAGSSWMLAPDATAPYQMGYDYRDHPANARGFRIALQLTPPAEPHLHLILHALTDTTGTPDSPTPGQPLGEVLVGDKVRVTWQIKNHGTPAPGIAVRSNAVTPLETIYRSPGVKNRGEKGGGHTRTATLATGETLYLSWDMDTTTWPPEPIKVSASIHASDSPDALHLETSAPGAALPWLSRQWLLPAFTLKERK